MLTKKLKIVSEFKTAMPLNSVDVIKVLLPYEDGRLLEKQTAIVLDANSGIIELSITDFELQGLKLGVNDFFAKVYMTDGSMLKVSFPKGCKIELDEATKRKVWASITPS